MYLFFDTETTGLWDSSLGVLDAEQPRMCQLAALVIDRNATVRAQMNTIIYPDGWTVPEQARNIHGLSTQTCVDYGFPIQYVLASFHSMLKSCKYAVAHNLEYDRNLVNREASLRLGETDWFSNHKNICVMLSSKPVLQLPGKYNDYKFPKLIEAYKHYFGKEFTDQHDAMADIMATKDVFFEMVKQGDLNPEEQ